MKKNIHIRVAGKIQGVNYRDNTREQAKKLGVNGYVQNEPDGTVYMEAEGEPDQLGEFIEWVQDGPEAADVENVWKDAGRVCDYEDFSVKA